MAEHSDVDRFNRWAATYERSWMQRAIFAPVQAAALELAAAAVPDPITILDVGCGTARLLRVARDRFPGARLAGVDAAEEMVETARRLAGDAISISHAAAEELPFPDASFDLVFSTLTFHHWTDQRRGMAEVARVMTRRGRWLLADFVAPGWMAAALRVIPGERVPERRRLDGDLTRSGLAVLSERRPARFGGQLPILSIGRPS